MYVLDLEQIAEEVKNAPSVFNSQPWYFRVTADDRIDMYVRLDQRDEMEAGRWDLAPSKNDAARLDPLAREFAISCGAALYNLRLAIRVAGHDLAVRLPPNPLRDNTLLASVEIVTERIAPPTNAEQELYEAIWRRDTIRWPHKIVPAPLAIIVAMEGAAAQEGASLRLLHPSQARKWLRLVKKADRFFEDEPDHLSPIARDRYRRHQEYRKHWTQRDDEGAGAGVPRRTFGPTPTNRVGSGRPTRKDFWDPDKKRRFERPPLIDKGPFERPQLMALSTDDDQILDWLRAGQALQHAILTGTRFSVSPPYGLAAKYHARYRYGVPARHHPVRRWRPDEFAYDGLSVSFLTQPLERYDIECYDIERYDIGHKDIKREQAKRDTKRKGAKHNDTRSRDAGHQGVPAKPPRPLPWRFAELPQVVIRVGYAAHPADLAPRRQPAVVDGRLKPPPSVQHAQVQLPEPRLPEPRLPERGLHGGRE